MKHSIRYRTVDPIRGKIVKVENVFGELGSGVYDKNGKEIFEGDLVKFRDNDKEVTFHSGRFFLGQLLLGGQDDLEVIGHVKD